MQVQAEDFVGALGPAATATNHIAAAETYGGEAGKDGRWRPGGNGCGSRPGKDAAMGESRAWTNGPGEADPAARGPRVGGRARSGEELRGRTETAWNGGGVGGGGASLLVGLELGPLELLALLLVGVLVPAEGLGVGKLPAAVLTLVFPNFSSTVVGRGTANR